MYLQRRYAIYIDLKETSFKLCENANLNKSINYVTYYDYFL